MPRPTWAFRQASVTLLVSSHASNSSLHCCGVVNGNCTRFRLIALNDNRFSYTFQLFVTNTEFDKKPSHNRTHHRSRLLRKIYWGAQPGAAAWRRRPSRRERAKDAMLCKRHRHRYPTSVGTGPGALGKNRRRRCREAHNDLGLDRSRTRKKR